MSDYGVGHINKWTGSYHNQVTDRNGYGAVAYYSSSKCGDLEWPYSYEECMADYKDSDISFIVDSWAQAKLTDKLVIVDGYKSRLIKLQEIPTEKQYILNGYHDVPIYNWLWNEKYSYWTMSVNRVANDGYAFMSIVNKNSSTNFSSNETSCCDNVIRPVVNISKENIDNN